MWQAAWRVAPRGGADGHRHRASPPAAHCCTWRKVGAAGTAALEQNAGHTLGTAIALSTGARGSPGWLLSCPPRDRAPRMVSLGEEGAAAPLVLGLVRGKGKRLGGKSTFLSLRFFFFFFFFL